MLAVHCREGLHGVGSAVALPVSVEGAAAAAGQQGTRESDVARWLGAAQSQVPLQRVLASLLHVGGVAAVPTASSKPSSFTFRMLLTDGAGVDVSADLTDGS